MRHSLCILLVSFLCLNILVPTCFSDEVVLKGSVERTIPQGSPFKLKIVSLPTSTDSFYMENWDFEGNFRAPKVGSKLVAELSKPVYVQSDLVLPQGTKFFGEVSQIIEPKSFGKDGRLEISFIGLQTPQGKTLQFKDKQSLLTGKELTKQQSFVRGIGRVGAYTAGGAAAGALIATQTAGAILTATNPYYILASGAGLGLLVGAVASVVKKGKSAQLSPGDELTINLEQSLVLPVAEAAPTNSLQTSAISGLTVEILRQTLRKDDLGKFILLLDLQITNNTNVVLSGNDFVLLGPYNRQMMPGGLSLAFDGKKNNFVDPIAYKQISQYKPVKGQIAFEVDFPNFEHTLILKDRQTQQVVFSKILGTPLELLSNSKIERAKHKIFGGGSAPWN